VIVQYVCDLNENRNLPKNLCENPVRRRTNICSVSVMAIHADSSNWSSNVQRVVRYMEWKVGEEYVGKMVDFHQSPNNFFGGSRLGWSWDNESWTVAIDTCLWYDIYLLQLGFHPLVAVDKLVQKKGDSHIQKEKQNAKIQNTQNRKQIYKTRKRT